MLLVLFMVLGGFGAAAIATAPKITIKIRRKNCKIKTLDTNSYPIGYQIEHVQKLTTRFHTGKLGIDCHPIRCGGSRSFLLVISLQHCCTICHNMHVLLPRWLHPREG